MVHFDQVREHFGIGLALEDVARCDQLRTQRRVVFDDAVVHDGDASGAVHVRMGVSVVGTAVGRPTRVAETDLAM